MLRINKVSTLWRGAVDIVKKAQPPAWILLLVSIASISYSQYLMEKRETVGNPIPIAEWFNNTYYLEIVNYDNVYYALPYLIGGAALCGLLALPSVWKKAGDVLCPHQPPRIGEFWSAHYKPIITALFLLAVLFIQLSNHQYFPIHLLIWLSAIFLLTRVFFLQDRKSGIDLSPEINMPDLFWIATLLAVGFIATTTALEDLPVHIIPDEGNFWETARAIAVGELHPPIFDSGVYTFPVASSIIQAWAMKLFGVNLWGWRFSSVIPAVLTIIPLYLLGKKWFGRPTAITACILMASNPYFISFARLGYNNSQSLLPVTFCFYFLALAIHRGGSFYTWLAGLAAGIGFYTYSSAWSGIVTLIATLLLLGLQKAMDWKRLFLSLGLILLAWATIYMPRIVFTSSGKNSSSLLFKVFETSFINPFYARSLYKDSDLGRIIEIGDGQKIFYEPYIYRELLLRGFVRSFISFFDPYIAREHFLNAGLAGVITPVFLLLGIAMSLRRFRQLRFHLPLTWFVVCFVFLSLIAAFPPRHTHLVSVIPCLALLSSIGLTGSVEIIIESFPARLERFSHLTKTTTLSVASLVCLYYGIQRYYIQMPRDYPNLFEDIVSWVAWHTDQPTYLVYLTNNEGPHRVEYLISAKLVPHSFNAHKIDEFSSSRDLILSGRTIIFLESQLPEDVFLFEKLPDNFKWTESYWYGNSYVQGHAISNFNTDLSPDLTWSSAVNSLTGQPVRFVLLGLVVWMYVFGMLSLEGVLQRMPNEFVLELGSPPSNLDLEDKSKRLDFYLKVRIPLKKPSNQLESQK